MKIGQSVVFVDALGVERDALVTAIGSDVPDTWVNVVIVSDDLTKRDPYGQQIERHTSVVHQSRQTAPGMYWRARE